MFSRLSHKLFSYFLIIIIVSLATVSIATYIKSSKVLDEQVEKYVVQMITHASYQTDVYLQNFERISSSILSNREVKRFLDMDSDDLYNHYLFTSQIQKSVMRPIFISTPQIEMIYMIGDHGKYIMDDTQNTRFIDNFNPDEVYNKLDQRTPENGSIALLKMSLRAPSSTTHITLTRKIRGFNSFDVKGILAIEINIKELVDIWDRIDLGDDGHFFILDETSQTIYQPEPDELRTHSVNDSSSYLEIIYEANRMFVYQISGYSKWRYVVSIPMDYLQEPISTIRNSTITVGFVTLIIAVLIAYRFNLSISRPIKLLRAAMKQTEKGNWQRIDFKERRDEIDHLFASYNRMVSKLSEMIEKVYEVELKNQNTALKLQQTELEQQKAEFQALQLQINPHFLYNTLEAINCYAIVNDSEEITEMVEAMAYMFRYSTQANLEEVTVANELNHVRNYMIILKHRIMIDFEIEVAIPPFLLLKKLVRLTMQPLIENIFQHAFKDGVKENHSIIIDAAVQGDLLQISIEDNGIGMSTDRLDLIRNNLRLNQLADDSHNSTLHSGGIGLMNVHRRIQMVYGTEFGLSVDSVEGKGTTIIMNLPYDKTNNRKAGLK